MVIRYDVPIVKITSGQRLALVAVKAEDLSAIYKDLGEFLERHRGYWQKKYPVTESTCVKKTCRQFFTHFHRRDPIEMAQVTDKISKRCASTTEKHSLIVL